MLSVSQCLRGWQTSLAQLQCGQREQREDQRGNPEAHNHLIAKCRIVRILRHAQDDKDWLKKLNVLRVSAPPWLTHKPIAASTWSAQTARRSATQSRSAQSPYCQMQNCKDPTP